MLWSLWDVTYAHSYCDESDDFQVGFRGDPRSQFRWVTRDPADASEAPDVRLVPLFVVHLLGPPCAWDAQNEGKKNKKTKIYIYC